MNWTQIKRVAWIDMRRIGPLAIVLALFWMFIFGVISVLLFSSPNFRTPMPPNIAMWFLVWTAAIYAGAWGAITFSMERSEKTIGFLRSLPLKPNNMLWGKVLFGVLSTIILALVLLGIGLIYRTLIIEFSPPATRHQTQTYDIPIHAVVLSATLIPILAAFGLFWSQKTSKPMRAVVATGVSTFLVVNFAKIINEKHGQQLVLLAVLIPVLALLGLTWWKNTPKRIVAAVAIVAAALVAYVLAHMYLEISGGGQVADLTVSWAAGLSSLLSLGILVLVRRNTFFWFQGEDSGMPIRSAFSAASIASAGSNPRKSGVVSLLWIQLRQQRLPIVLSLVALIYSVWSVLQNLARNESLHVWESAWAFWPIGLVLFACLGFSVFRREHHESRFRLLSQLGASPVVYWATQLAIPALAAVAFLEAFGLRFPLSARQGTGYAWATCLAIFSACQFCSIAWRSGVIAGAAASVATVIVSLWFYACYFIDVPYWLAGGPVIVLLLLASLLRVSRWFRETRSWKQWVVPLLPLVALIGMPVLVCWYRAFEVPATDSVFTATGFKHASAGYWTATPEEIESAKAYEEVFALLLQLDSDGDVPGDTPVGDSRGALFFRMWRDLSFDINLCQTLTDWVNANQVIVDQLVETIEENEFLYAKLKPTWRSVNDRGLTHMDSSPTELGSESAVIILLARARMAEDQGEINEAWRYYASVLRLAFRQHNRFSGLDGPELGARIEHIVYRELVAWAMHENNTPEQVETAAVVVNQLRSERIWRGAEILTAEHTHACANLENKTSSLQTGEQLATAPVSSLHESWSPKYGINTLLMLIADWSPWEKQRMQKLTDWGYWAESTYRNSTAQETNREMAYHTLGYTFPKGLLERLESHTALKNQPFFQSGTSNTHYTYSSKNLVSNEHVRRGAICQLALIANYMRTGEYPTDLTAVKLDGKPLPGDIYYALEYLSVRPSVPFAIGPDLAPDGKQAEGTYVYSHVTRDRADDFQVSAYSDSSEDRFFLLPKFGEWTREKYRDRLVQTSRRSELDEEDDDASVPDNAETEATR